MSTFYMGTSALGDSCSSLTTYRTLDQAIRAVSDLVSEEGTTRYIVKVVARIAPGKHPVKVTRLP